MPATPTPLPALRATAAGTVGRSFGSATPLWLTVGIAILTPLATLGAVWLTQRFQWQALQRTLRHQSDQEALKDARHLRDRQYESEREAYEILGFATWALKGVIHRQAFLLDSETEEQRDKREHEYLGKALSKTQEALVHLTMAEGPTAAEVRDLYQRLWTAFLQHQMRRGTAKHLRGQGMGALLPPAMQELANEQERLSKEIDSLAYNLERTAHARLTELAQPITRLPDDLPPARGAASRRSWRATWPG